MGRLDVDTMKACFKRCLSQWNVPAERFRWGERFIGIPAEVIVFKCANDRVIDADRVIFSVNEQMACVLYIGGELSQIVVNSDDISAGKFEEVIMKTIRMKYVQGDHTDVRGILGDIRVLFEQYDRDRTSITVSTFDELRALVRMYEKTILGR